MNKKLLIACSLLLTSSTTLAQQGDGGFPRGAELESTLTTVDTRLFSQPDVDALRAEDLITDKQGNAPWRFGFNNETDLSMTNAGTWTTHPDGGLVWQLRLECQAALTINLTLDNVVIPTGNELYVYNEDKSFILGNFTSNHLYKGELGTELVPGDVAIIEYYVAAENTELNRSLHINRVTHGYRTAGEFIEKAFGSSGDCNMNVNCPDGDDWEYQKRSAVMLVSGSSGFCSGSLINNTLNDGTPYVLTANHCYSNPTSWIFRFNWESNGCTNPNSSPSFESLSGATLRAKRTPSDFCLVEITGGLVGGTVPPAYNAFLAGWNNQDTAPNTTVCIHHPSGDIKKIAFDDEAAISVQAMGSSENNSSWEVHWDRNTTTEGGSSGSPLFDQDKRIIGQLWGGGASCWNLNAPDYYGKLSSSWEPSGSSNNAQLKFWLDPNNSGVGAIDGFYTGGDLAVNNVDAGLDFTLYPNPSNGTFNVQLNVANLQYYALTVTDLTGRTIYTSPLTSNNMYIDLVNASNGTYLITVIGKNVNLTRTLIIK
ncbi:MAG: trypsin-like peptidase domain-containing protein, partial [Crocinitomicaceae bacterium]|nr:trypsin-like peptidase domain-containing protein [Crocinitomicaceae bacterium]